MLGNIRCASPITSEHQGKNLSALELKCSKMGRKAVPLRMGIFFL